MFDRTGCHDLSWSMLTNGLKWQTLPNPKLSGSEHLPHLADCHLPITGLCRKGPDVLFSQHSLSAAETPCFGCQAVWSPETSRTPGHPKQVMNFCVLHCPKHSWLSCLELWELIKRAANKVDKAQKSDRRQYRLNRSFPGSNTIEQHEGNVLTDVFKH